MPWDDAGPFIVKNVTDPNITDEDLRALFTTQSSKVYPDQARDDLNAIVHVGDHWGDIVPVQGNEDGTKYQVTFDRDRGVKGISPLYVDHIEELASFGYVRTPVYVIATDRDGYVAIPPPPVKDGPHKKLGKKDRFWIASHGGLTMLPGLIKWNLSQAAVVIYCKDDVGLCVWSTKHLVITKGNLLSEKPVKTPFPPFASLYHELSHAYGYGRVSVYDEVINLEKKPLQEQYAREQENVLRVAMHLFERDTNPDILGGPC